MAGVFGFFNFERPGKGIEKSAQEEKPKKGLALFFSVFFRNFWKMVQANLLYLLFCIPVVTVGPATGALTYILQNLAEGEHVWVLAEFWEQFKKQFKKTFFFGIIDLFVLFSTLYVYLALPQDVLSKLPAAFTFAKYFMLIPLLIYIFMRFYIYTIAVKYESTFYKTIIDSFLLALVTLYKNIYIGILCVLFTAVHIFSTIGIFTIIFYGFSMFGLLIVVYILPVLQKYALEDDETA